MCSSNCPYMTSIEDRNCGTNYPACTCGREYCEEFKGYCPIRDN